MFPVRQWSWGAKIMVGYSNFGSVWTFYTQPYLLIITWTMRFRSVYGKIKLRVNRFMLMIAQDLSTRGKCYHIFIFFMLMVTSSQTLANIAGSGLYFAINRPEALFLRAFMFIWLSLELAGQAKVWWSHTQISSSTLFPSWKNASETTSSLNVTFPGFTLLENN